MGFTIKLAGIQGDGIDTVGELMAGYLHQRGLHVYGYRNFTSRIRGGYSSHEVVFSESRIRTKTDGIDILIALDAEALLRDLADVAEGGVVLADESAVAKPAERIISLPLLEQVKKELGEIYKWVASLGALARLLGLPTEPFGDLLSERFSAKGEKVVAANLAALRLGYDMLDHNLPLPPGLSDMLGREPMPPQGILTQGSEAVVRAALTAGCNFVCGYPISPASEVFSLLAKEFTPGGRGQAVQTEDEISAVMMAIGASYAGAVPMLATSGPGLSLMAEGIGLASMTRTPLLIVDAQRTGPSTGMPTKHEQSDLALALAGSHGDTAPIVMAPSCVEDIAQDIPRAYHLAELYRSPVLFLTDFALMSARTNASEYTGQLPDTADVRARRTVPGTPEKMFHRTGNQAGENGLPTDMPQARIRSMTERMAELCTVPDGENFTLLEGGGKVLLVAMGSTRGAIEAAMPQLVEDASAVLLRLLSPFPVKEMTALFDRFDRVMVFDSNAGGQLLAHIRSHYPQHGKLFGNRRFDGEPFAPADITGAVREVLSRV